MNEEEEKKKTVTPPEETTQEAPSVQPQKETRKSKLLGALIDDEESDDLKGAGWRDVMRALDVDGQWFRRQMGVILLAVVGIIIYITNRYQAQQQIIELEQLQNEQKDMKFRVLTRSSELTLRTRQSQLEEQLKTMGDSTLLPMVEAPFIIETTDEK